jgi:uncharacterized protein YndB with AHSA1/START domain
MTDEHLDVAADAAADVAADVAAATEPGGRVTRTVDVDAGVEEVWSAISDPEQRSHWLDDDDARARELRVDRVDAGRRLVWTWWRRGDEPGASRVEIVVAPTPAGTRVVVTETVTESFAAPTLRARATGRSASVDPVTLRPGDRWSYRLLGLELLFVAAGALVR